MTRYGCLGSALEGAEVFLSPEITDVLSAGDPKFVPCGGEFRRFVGEVERSVSVRFEVLLNERNAAVSAVAIQHETAGTAAFLPHTSNCACSPAPLTVVD
ncbi:MAG: hypothetical protein FJ395_05780 [Verrucomicrobia bacterium]|nr:hypothetical protein [Verrucomicrobiota bacterium]